MMAIQNGPAPEGSVIGGNKEFWFRECNRLRALLQESERLRTEAFQACETMRLERNDWQRKAEYQQQQATRLQQQLADADAQIRQFEKINDTRDELQCENKALQAQLAAVKNEASKTGLVIVGSHLPSREQLDADIVRLTNNLMREAEERKALQQQVADLQAQLEAAAVTPAQQPDSNAAVRLEAVRRMIGEIWGWYACVGRLDGMTWAEAWEQVGALLGHLQQEAD